MGDSPEVDVDLEVEMELVYELVADAEDEHLAEALEEAWFQCAEEQFVDVDDAAPPPTLRRRVMRAIGLAA